MITCTIRCSASQTWPTEYKHGTVYARNLESINFIDSVTDTWPYGSTHPAPQLLRVLHAIYWAGIVKPVHKPTNPRKHCTQNTNWWVRLKLKQNDGCLSEELQSPFRSCLKMWAGGQQLTEKCGVEILEIRRRSESITPAMKKSRRHWHMIVPTIIARHRAQSVACLSSNFFRETDTTRLREKCLSYGIMLQPCKLSSRTVWNFNYCNHDACLGFPGMLVFF